MINPDSYYLRNPDLVAVGTAKHYLFIQADGSLLELSTSYPAQWSRLMQLLMAPMRGEMLQRQLADGLAINPDDLLLLRSQGILLEAPTADELKARRSRLFTDNQGYYFARGQQVCPTWWWD